ncbi:MAG: ATP-binding protein [Blautia wexlerae]
MKFTPVGGTVNIRVSEKPCRRDGYTTVVFSVKDNGIGMSPEFREQVFDSFTREHTVTENGIGGTGLGMAITKNIVDMLGGTIQVESEVGKGTEFTVMLECEISGTTVKEEPDSQKESPLRMRSRKSGQKSRGSYEGKKVLLVEDNELNREIATAIMEEIRSGCGYA